MGIEIVVVLFAVLSFFGGLICPVLGWALLSGRNHRLLLEGIEEGSTYVLARAQRVVSGLRERYLERGFLSVEVRGPEIEMLEEGRVAVRVEVLSFSNQTPKSTPAMGDTKLNDTMRLGE